MSLLITSPNEITARLAPVFDAIEQIEARLLASIQDLAQSGGDMSHLQELAQRVAKLRELRTRGLPAVEQLLVGALADSGGKLREDDDAHKGSDGLRTLQVEVTEGMIKQSLFSLTQARKDGLVSLGEKFTVRLPDGSHFETELIEPGNRFRERSKVRSFYVREKIEDGDTVVLTEDTPGHWRLLSGRVGEGKRIVDDQAAELAKQYGL